MKRVLVVASDIDVGFRASERLEDEGHEVSWCPGPRSPRFTCLGGCGRYCPLAGAADVVVLDGWLDSDLYRRGVPSWHLLRYYRERGLPVVALIGPDGLPGPLNDDGVVALPRDAGAREISGAVRSLLELELSGVS
jgi:hypothetical protein